jgi:hypothetical protein
MPRTTDECRQKDRRFRRWNGVTAWLLFGASIAWCVRLHAGDELSPEDELMRSRLMDEAKAAHDRHDCAEARQKAEKALSLKSTPSLLRIVAREARDSSAFAEALATSHECFLAATRDKNLRNRKEIMVDCQAIEAAVKGLVGNVVVKINGGPDSLSVKVSGHELKPAEYGDPYPVDPGALTVEASAPGYETFHAEVSVGRGDMKSVTISLVQRPAPVSLSERPMGAQAAPDIGGTGPVERPPSTGGELRFDDVWSGDYQCPAGQHHAESVNIVQSGRNLVATKTLGDPCVPAGVVTWRGTLPKPVVTQADLPLTIPVRMTVGLPNGRRSEVNVRLRIDGTDHLTMVGAGGTEFIRGAQISAPAAPEPPLLRQPVGYRPAPETAAPTFDSRGMPPVVEISRRITSADPLDAEARRAAAFTHFAAILQIATENRLGPAERTLLASYLAAGRVADQRGQSMIARGPRRNEAPATAWFRTRARYDNEPYRLQLLNLCSPDVKAAYLAHRR